VRIERLELRAAPGMRAGFSLDALAAGVNVIVGRNGSGKSTLVRAVRALLWEEEAFRGDVRSKWVHDGGSFDASREIGLPPQWTSHLAGARAPSPPDARFRACFTLSVDDFLRDGTTDAEIAAEIRRELSAGFDLELVMQAERARTALKAVAPAKSLAAGQRDVVRIQAEHRTLLAEERKIGELKERREQAKGARERVLKLDQALALGTERVDLAKTRLELSEYPQGMDSLQGGEADRIAELRSRIAHAKKAMAKFESKRDEARAKIAHAQLADVLDPERLIALENREERLRAIEHRYEQWTEGFARADACLEQARAQLFELTEGAEITTDSNSWDQLEELLRQRDDASARLERSPEVDDSEEDSGPEPALGVSVLVAGALLVALGVYGVMTISLAGWGLVGAGLATMLLELRNRSLQQNDRRARSEHRRGQEKQRRRDFEAARKAHEQIEAGLANACRALGWSGRLATLSLQQLSIRARELVVAEKEASSAGASLTSARSSREEELRHVQTELAAIDTDPVGDVVELRRVRTEMARRDVQLRAGRKDEASALQQLAEAGRDWEDSCTALTQFVNDSGLEDVDDIELSHRLSLLSEYRELRASELASVHTIARHEQNLSDHPEFESMSLESAREALRTCKTELAEIGDVDLQLVRIQEQVKNAREGNDLEQALASEQQLQEALEEVRDDLMEAACANYLLDSVQVEHRQHAEPDILLRASKLFEGFTSQAYQLGTPIDASDNKAGFSVRETEGPLRRLEELSSGTLSQLQLALRLAVAQGLEDEAVMPILLDEALTNSDPVRFSMIARSLGQLAEQGRQVIFLSSDRDDATRIAAALREDSIAAPKLFDLDELQAHASAAPSLTHTPLPVIPTPVQGESVTAFGERLRVPRLDPFEGVDAQHLFYAFTHDLSAMSGLLQERVDTVGQVRLLLDKTGVSLLDVAQRQRFDATQALIATWFTAYRSGRGLPLTAAVIREGPVSATFQDRLIAVSEDLGRDAHALFIELSRKGSKRDERLKGFKASKVEELKTDLEARGCFSPDTALDSDELRERVLQTAEPWMRQGVVEREDVFQLVNALAQWSGLEASKSAAITTGTTTSD
jgi:exonuclease SbcC